MLFQTIQDFCDCRKGNVTCGEIMFVLECVIDILRSRTKDRIRINPSTIDDPVGPVIRKKFEIVCSSETIAWLKPFMLFINPDKEITVKKTREKDDLGQDSGTDSVTHACGEDGGGTLF